MSAVLQDTGVANSAANIPSNRFTAHLTLASGVSVSIHALSLATLQATVAKLQPAEAANDTAAPGKPAAATAPAGSPDGTTAAASAPPAAAPAAQGEAGNAGAAASQQPVTAAASSASLPAASTSPVAASVTFDELKKAFLALSTKPDGRAKCEGVLKPFGLAKLSEAKPEQYAAVLAEIKKAAG